LAIRGIKTNNNNNNQANKKLTNNEKKAMEIALKKAKERIGKRYG